MSDLVYHLPLTQLATYRGHRVIVRAAQPHDLIAQLGPQDLRNLAYVQFCALPDDIDGLLHWAEGLPIELHLDAPARDFTRLYRCVKLLDTHPVRVSLPVVPGFEKAAKLALSLQFAVRLHVGQPPPSLIDPLITLLEAYLHQSTVAQPVEWFHSLLLGLCQGDTATLWALNEEDPARLRHIDAQGRERWPGRLAAAEFDTEPAEFVARWGDGLRRGGTECARCPFFAPCRGYFKWPRRDYDCAGVKAVLAGIHGAADELRRDLAAAPSVPRGTPL